MFLNKSNFVNHLFRLFDDAKDEIVLVVPYIKTSEEVYKALQNCDKRGVEILMVCREDGLTDKEFNKLNQLKHLTLLSHPNLHSKIYLNELHIIIGSMNLYEYSEKFNREAGIKLSVNGGKHKSDDSSENCKQEILEIINASTVIKLSDFVSANSLRFNCLLLKEDKKENKVKKLNKLFKTKSFKIINTKEGNHPTCLSYYDNIGVAISNRISIMPNYEQHVLTMVFDELYNMSFDSFLPYRIYLNDYNKMLTIYPPSGDSLEALLFHNSSMANEIEDVVTKVCERFDRLYKSCMQ
ncbi:hypothetical protein J4050_12090 [Winogradskyella sp. DF17]|uniref:Phospholipase D-like domain-containing protein n=1 Tax=Winogradskyella pelagia TaxID=2819984 RepID=A0ABS3T427_9FLAO|nr:phospholipase D-like domain-containing protein [Winogradskyella sp. DF17]MBO3117494.1 hypothetical protein [Winogradskyella sp. DF17]